MPDQKTYLGLARKWRPQALEDLVGQSHIALTLSHALKIGRIHQGYLFTGTRGIGKTSAARILAKSLRCTKLSSNLTPCNQCQQCIEINESRSIDVLEIDGASNNGVDAVREIRENAKYLPSNGHYKIYIIDEVHMLTTAAFNALLKTLEEPPAHVIFIFATTDPQKIPATVLSRCQRFDFKRVSQKDLQERLKYICQSEKITILPDATSLLAREAEGSMRDAVSLLDQAYVISQGKEITAPLLTDALGLIDKQVTLQCIHGILKRQPLQALEAVGQVHLHGFDLKQFGKELLRYLRLIMIARLLEQNKTSISLDTYLDISDIEFADVKSLTQLRSTEDLDMLFCLLNHGLEDVARSPIPKTIMDILLIKMASSEELISLSNTEKIDDVLSTQTTRVSTIAAIPTITAAAPSSQTLDLNWWTQQIHFLKSQKPLVGSILEHLSLEFVSLENNLVKVCLGYTKDHSFYKEQLQASQMLIQQLVQKNSGYTLRIEYKEVATNNSLENRNKTLFEEKKCAILESDVLKATQTLLGAKLEKLSLKDEEKCQTP